jgi:hypothetical protein
MIVNCYLASASVNNTLPLSSVYQISPDLHCHLPEKSQSSNAGNNGAPTSVPLSLGHALYFLSINICDKKQTSISIYLSGLVTAVAVFRNQNTIPFCLTTDLLLNVLLPMLLVPPPSTQTSI